MVYSAHQPWLLEKKSFNLFIQEGKAEDLMILKWKNSSCYSQE
jgi:hypothetical protein